MIKAITGSGVLAVDVALLGNAFCTRGGGPTVSRSEAIKNVRAAANGATIGGAEVLVIPQRAASGHAVGVSDLESGWFYRVSVKGTFSGTIMERLLKAIAAAEPAASTAPAADLRWACIVTDQAGNRLISVYIDPVGNIAIVQNERVTLRPELLRWFEDSIGCVDRL